MYIIYTQSAWILQTLLPVRVAPQARVKETLSSAPTTEIDEVRDLLVNVGIVVVNSE